MTSEIFNFIGLGGLDAAYLFFILLICIIILFIIVFQQMDKFKRLQKKYDKFMKGRDGKSLEKEIIALSEDNKFIKVSVENNKKDIKKLDRNFEFAYQKMGLVKYDAFSQMGGKLSFCLALLDCNNNGFLINSVHSSDGCYSYTKRIVKGICDIDLGNEEKEAISRAINSQKESSQKVAVE